MKQRWFVFTLVGLVFIALASMMPVAVSAEDFTIIVLPDTQNYSCGAPCGSSSTIFSAQTQWIVSNKEALNIVYVAHAGDIVEHATTAVEWDRASGAMSLLEDPVTTSLPDGIPYGVLRGNHDQESTYNYYNQHFGVGRFSGRSYYGGGFNGTNNNNNYGIFRASGMDFIVINLEYNPSAAVLNWANALLETYSNRRAIIVSHYIINTGNPGAFSSAGQAIYNALKDNPNLFLMLCGHMHGEGRRVDVYNGNTVNTLLADYQSYADGGNGFLRILHFSPARNEITVETYSPSLDQYERDADSQFMLQYDMGGPPKSHGDFDLDGKSDIAVWRPTNGVWYIQQSSDGGMLSPQWGLGSLGDVPVPGDYDGDRKTDVAVWRPSSGVWYIQKSSDGGILSPQWGLGSLGDVPVPGDYDGDGKTDPAVWRPSNGVWYIQKSSNGGMISLQWGLGSLGDVPVPGDYDGDGKTDVAVWRPSSGVWYIQRSSDGGITSPQWGLGSLGDIPVPGDYDGDGKTDVAVWRPEYGVWFIQKSSDGGMLSPQWGSGAWDDIPIKSLY